MPDRLLVNWPLKLFSLGLAFMIWLWVAGEERIVQDFRIPLDVRVRADRILAELPPTAVTVRLRGPETLIRGLDSLKLGVLLDLQEVPPGPRDVQLSREHLSGVPRSVEVAFIDPARVNLVVEQRMRRELPISADLLGQPPQGYALYHVQVRPETLLVEGPEPEVMALSSLETSPIRLDQRTGSFVQSVRTIIEEPHVRVVDPRPLEARVVIDRTPLRLTLDGVPVSLTGRTYAATVTPSQLQVTLSTAPSLLDKVRRTRIRAVADVTHLRPGAEPYRIPVRIEFPDLATEEIERIIIESVSREQVSVSLSGGAGG